MVPAACYEVSLHDGTPRNVSRRPSQCVKGDSRSVFPSFPHKVPSRVFKEKSIRFQVCLRPLSRVVCGRILINSRIAGCSTFPEGFPRKILNLFWKEIVEFPAGEEGSEERNRKGDWEF